MWHCFRHIIDEEPSFRWLKTPAGQKAFHSHRNHYMCDVHQVQEEERFEMIGKAWVSNRAERSWAALVCGLPCSNVHFWIVGTMCNILLANSTPLWTVHPCTLFTCTLHNNFWAGGWRALAPVVYFCSIYTFPLVRKCTVCTVYIVHTHFTVQCIPE